ncbi:hypothetical protein CAOG_002350 [Capsaspora owczarzaki ATCC 30864]|uniref:trimethyllysine dioxygenase n=2 Tax=Capsaspora owczarzaki (strain ATCC 30864) TaxID=595528 RepID=A0A0D2U7W4_CAPO3|nr:hypothetical protein CAOG_002350 [Capsaspora owczarzaki ATCC 30864]
MAGLAPLAAAAAAAAGRRAPTRVAAAVAAAPFSTLLSGHAAHRKAPSPTEESPESAAAESSKPPRASAKASRASKATKAAEDVSASSSESTATSATADAPSPKKATRTRKAKETSAATEPSAEAPKARSSASTASKTSGDASTSLPSNGENGGKHGKAPTFVNVSVDTHNNMISIQAGGSEQVLFSTLWLRDHCRCSDCYNSQTNQRSLDTYKLPPSLLPESIRVVDGAKVVIQWPAIDPARLSEWAVIDNPGSLVDSSRRPAVSSYPAPEHAAHTSTYDVNWLLQFRHNNSVELTPPAFQEFPIQHWGSDLVQESVTVPFKEIMETEAGLFKWMDNLAKFGISFASGVPPTEAASEALCLKLGVLRNTNYSSGMWTLQPNMSKEDTAYSHAALKAHTDNTYYTDPCGLQVLHCIGFDGQLGHNIFVDGFNAASQLMLTHPGHLAVLSKTRVPFQWVDKNEQFYAAAPIITLNPYTGEPFQIRQNNDDRAPLLVSPHAQRSFYYALHAWYSLLRDPRHEFKTILRPGTLVAFDNHRVLHGRESFTGNRTVVGCYIGRDEFRSRYRSLRDANAAKPSGAKQA